MTSPLNKRRVVEDQVARQSPASWRNQSLTWFQLAKMRLTISRFAPSGFAVIAPGKSVLFDSHTFAIEVYQR
jgi:hypothetical protein